MTQTASQSKPFTTTTTILIGIRLVVGGVAVVAPGRLERTALGSATRSSGGNFFIRLFGIRDVVYGIGLATAAPLEQKRWLIFGIATDVGDLLAGVLATRKGAARNSLPLVAGPLVAGILGALSASARLGTTRAEI